MLRAKAWLGIPLSFYQILQPFKKLYNNKKKELKNTLFKRNLQKNIFY